MQDDRELLWRLALLGLLGVAVVAIFFWGTK